MLLPAFFLVAQAASQHLLHPVPLQVQEGRERQLEPTFHWLKFLEFILIEAQARLEFLKKEFDLLSQRVQLDHLTHRKPWVVRHQDFDVVRCGSLEIFLRRRKDESDRNGKTGHAGHP